MKRQSLTALLAANAYPGRGIVLGRTADGKSSAAVYFIMGRSANSRNRVFAETADGIRTQAHDPSQMTDPSLIIYHPVRETEQGLIVTNGDQTDTIRDALAAGGTFETALDTRTFEPDPPHYTPRISGLLARDGSFALSILKSADGNPDCRRAYTFRYQLPPAGEGRFLHTYQGDGNPLPSFEGEPVPVELDADSPDALADAVWNALHPENRVSLYVRFADLSTGAARAVLRNRFA